MCEKKVILLHLFITFFLSDCNLIILKYQDHYHGLITVPYYQEFINIKT